MDDPIDCAATLELVGGKREFLQELVQMFLEDYPPLLEEIRVAAVGHDPARLRRSAHTLRGIVGNFGARGAFDAAGTLEQMGRSGDCRGAEEAYRALAEVVRQLPPALAELVSE